MTNQEKSEVRDRMKIEWDVPIHMDDGIVLRADVYRPIREGRYPVIMNHGTYAKWLHLEDACPPQKVDPLEIQRFFKIAIGKFLGMTTKQIPC